MRRAAATSRMSARRVACGNRPDEAIPSDTAQTAMVATDQWS